MHPARSTDSMNSNSSRPRPALHVVYDSPSHEKQRCPPCFVENTDGEPMLTNKGRYYKNVRREWASLVSTPVYAKYNDALAFTRSIGDFHLHCYGVSASPEVLVYDLNLHQTELNFNNKVMALLLSSDGVWDNWTYEDCVSYLLDPSCLNLLRNPSKKVSFLLFISLSISFHPLCVCMFSFLIFFFSCVFFLRIPPRKL